MDLQAIRIALKQKNYTYAELSKRSKIPLGTIKHIMSGRTPNPRIDTLQAIEEALELNQSSVKFTAQDKALGVGNYRVKLSEEEYDWLELFHALKDEKGEQTLHAVITMLKSITREK